jgi:hypothetical protein
MSISYPSSVASTATVGTTVSIAASTTSATIAAANPARLLGGLIVNKGNKKLWVRFDTLPASAAFPSIDVPASGGSIDIPDGYIGAITGIWETGATGAATVIEFNAA